MIKWALVLFLAIFSTVICAQTKGEVTEPQDTIKADAYSLENYKRSKLGTIILTVLTGPVGGHRLYLGTRPLVPIIYTLTLGGGMGLLPLIDLIQTIFTKDLETLEDRKEIILLPK